MSKKFKIGDLVTINSTSTGIRKDETVQKFGLEMGQEVRLIRYDPKDETWLVQGKDGSWPAVWIKRRCLKPLEAVAAQPAWAFKIGDNVQVGTDETIYTIEQHPTRENDVNITWMDEDGKQSTAYTKEQINRYLTKEDPHWKLITPKAEEPKPVETKKPRLMLCVDMSGNSLARYTVGKVYELRTEDNDDYYYFKASDDGPGDGGMFKYRFIELKDGVENSIKVLCTNNSGGYGKLLTVGKTYEAVSSIDGEDFWTIPVSDKGTQATAYKHRFTVLTDETAQREWKGGDTLLISFLNDPNIEKEFHGYDAGWNIYTERVYIRDRTIEVIAEREGKMAARISGTWDIWITLESLEKHP
jgi:hypothetical protein